MGDDAHDIDIADFALIGDCRHRALAGFADAEFDDAGLWQQRPAPASRPERAERCQRQKIRLLTIGQTERLLRAEMQRIAEEEDETASAVAERRRRLEADRERV